MGYNKRRVENIIKNVPLSDVLYQLGYPVTPNNLDGEEQFPCDLHGSNDTRASARLYAADNRWHCFACSKQRSAVDTIMDKFGKTFHEACSILERQYGLLPPERFLEDDPYEEDASPKVSPYEGEAERTRKVLQSLTTDGILPYETAARLWDAFDRVGYLHRKTEDVSLTNRMVQIREKAFAMAGAE